MLEWVAGLLMVVAISMQVARFSRAPRHSVILLASFAPISFALAAAAAALLATSSHAILADVSVGIALAMLIGLAAGWLGRPTLPARRPACRVLSANMWVGKGDPATVVRLAREHDVTIVALQELTPEALEGLKRTGLSEAFPHAVEAPRPDWDGVALFSRAPLRDVRVTQVDHLLRAEAVVALNPEAPDLDPVAISLHIEAPWPKKPQEWRRQLIELRGDLEGRTRPVIAMGDYNATAHHALFRDLLRGGGVDAAAEARAWTTRTFPGLRRWSALIGIDHIVLRGLTARSVSTHWVPGSDHRAVVASLSYPT
ncbi:MAG: endonuclease/exonuclease/phosphatase family protein [Actinomycetota bacterium]|nr:endonuclease/exonuclease/phosphatase family protein [Actinomycetota bacterium]